jgi:hypothetical protein
MTEKIKLSRTGKVAAVLSLVFAGTGAGYYFGTASSDPFSQLTNSLQTAVQQEIAENEEAARQAAFTKDTCEDIDEALDKVFQSAGATHDFTATLTPREGRRDICRIYLKGEEIFAFNDTSHFDPEDYRNRQDIETFMDKSINGLTNEQLVKLQKTLPAFLKDLAP